MRQYRYDSKEYVRAQRRGSMRCPGRASSATAGEIKIIANDIKSNVVINPNGICHGARKGIEIELFQQQFSQSSSVLGTDLMPLSDDIIRHDFQKQKRGWMGHFDFVYSNSLDHANDPELAVKVWLNQLKQYGRLYVTWSSYSKLEDRELPYPGGDCFGASLEEYILLLGKMGRVIDLLFLEITDRDKVYVTVVAGR